MWHRQCGRYQQRKKTMLPTPLSGSPQKEIPLYMLKDRTKQALRFSEEQKYDMSYEGKC